MKTAPTKTSTKTDVCRPCESGLWATGAHREHAECMTRGCACPICHGAPAPEVSAVLDAIEKVRSLLPARETALV